MAYSDIKIFLENFEKEIKEIEKRYNTDQNHNILRSYLPMAIRIRKNVANYLNPAIKEVELVRMRYSEKYSMKDIGFHTQQAEDSLNYMKKLLKELVELYENQENYAKISEQWKSAFPSINKRMKELISRLMLIERILKDEF